MNITSRLEEMKKKLQEKIQQSDNDTFDRSVQVFFKQFGVSEKDITLAALGGDSELEKRAIVVRPSEDEDGVFTVILLKHKEKDGIDIRYCLERYDRKGNPRFLPKQGLRIYEPYTGYSLVKALLSGIMIATATDDEARETWLHFVQSLCRVEE